VGAGKRAAENEVVRAFAELPYSVALGGKEPFMRIVAGALPLIVLLALASACGGDDDAAADATTATPDANPTAPDADPTAPDADPTTPDADPGAPDASTPPDLPRGLAWVRENPMFISGLTVAMPTPSTAQVGEYFDLFEANAVHLWEDGLPTEMDGWAAAGHAGFRFVSWVRPDGTSHDGGLLIGGYPANAPGRIGYQIGDEPRNMDQLIETDVGVDAVRAHDPDALIIVNFSYSADGLAAMLDEYGANMDGDVVSFDTYSFSSNVYGRLKIFRDIGIEYDMPYWCYLRSYADAGSGEWSTESDMRWNVFAHALFGYTGYTWFVYQLGPPHSDTLAPALFQTSGDFAATKTARYDLAAELNVELANLGRALTQLTSTDVRYITGLLVPDGLQAWEADAGENPFITAIAPVGGMFQEVMVGFFDDDDGEKYVMVQNVNHESGSWPVNNDNDATIKVSFDFSAVTDAGFDKSAVLSLNKETAAIDTVPLTSTGADTADLDVTLVAGDAMIFKYKSGKPFALQ
jgi:hypothetical protein